MQITPINTAIDRILGVGKPTLDIPSVEGETDVEKYWENHTVGFEPTLYGYPHSLWGSEQHLKYIDKNYPYFNYYIGVNDDHAGRTILDYGCGIGNQTIQLARKNPKKIYAADISQTALALCKHRCKLHGIPEEMVDFIKVFDEDTRLPFDDESIDYISCIGVLMHATHPSHIMREFYRVLKPGCSVCVYFYNKSSIFYHYHCGYKYKNPGETTVEVFTRISDSDKTHGVCPKTQICTRREFVRWGKSFGFDVYHVGNSLTPSDMEPSRNDIYNLFSTRLENEDRVFLDKITFNNHDEPMYYGQYAGLGGVYVLFKE